MCFHVVEEAVQGQSKHEMGKELKADEWWKVN